MSKYIRAAGILLGIGLIFCIGKCFYMVACISCTTPPIETYKYSGSMDDLERGLKAYAQSKPNTSCKVSYRGGLADLRSARDVAITEFVGNDSLKYQLVIYDFNGSTRLDLDCLYSTFQKLGGCSKDNKGVEELFDNFKLQFLPAIKRNQGISLKTTLF